MRREKGYRGVDDAVEAPAPPGMGSTNPTVGFEKYRDAVCRDHAHGDAGLVGNNRVGIHPLGQWRGHIGSNCGVSLIGRVQRISAKGEPRTLTVRRDMLRPITAAKSGIEARDGTGADTPIAAKETVVG